MQVLHAQLFDQALLIAHQFGEFLLHELVRTIDSLAIALHFFVAGAHQLAQKGVIDYAGGSRGLDELSVDEPVQGHQATTSEMMVTAIV